MAVNKQIYKHRPWCLFSIDFIASEYDKLDKILHKILDQRPRR